MAEPGKPTDRTTDTQVIDDDARKSASVAATAVGDRDALAAVRGELGTSDMPGLQLTGSEFLSPEGIDKSATRIHEAAFRRNLWGIGHAEPDVSSIVLILDTMKSGDRQKVEKQYESTYHRSLRADLQDKLGAGSDNWSRVEALLNRKDGTSDEAGQIRTAMSRLGNAADREEVRELQNKMSVYAGNTLGVALNAFASGSDEDLRVRAEQDIRRSIGSMTSSQLEQVKKDYRENYKTDLEADLMQNPDLSQNTKDALKILFMGVEKRTGSDPESVKNTVDLAKIALRAGNMDLFADAMETGSDAARKQFLSEGGQKSIDKVWSGDNRAKATSLAERGVPDLISKIEGNNHWYHTNRQEITRLVSTPTAIDREQFVAGRKLVEAGSLGSTLEEKQAIAFYSRMHDALKRIGDNREVADWEAKLAGDNKIVSSVLSARTEGYIFGFGAGVDRDQLFKNIEKIDNADWQRLHDNPADLSRVDAALKVLASPEDRVAIMQMLREKISAPSFVDSKQAGRRSIDDAFKTDDPVVALERLATLTAKERQEFVNKPQHLTDLVNTLSTGGPREEGQRLLNQYKRGEAPGPLDTAFISAIKGDDPRQVITSIQKAFESDPKLLERMKAPTTEEDQFLRKRIQIAAENAISDSVLGPKLAEKLINNGRLPLENLLRLDKDARARYETVLAATPEEKRLLLADPDVDRKAEFLQDAAFQNENERKMLQFALKQGGMDNADKVRAFVLGDSTNAEELKTMLAKMTPDEKQDLANTYFTKYEKLLSEDVVNKVPKSEQFRMREMLSPTDVNVRQIALDARTDAYDHTSAFDPILNRVWDRTQEGAVDANNQLDQFIKKNAQEIEKLSPENRKLFDDAVKNYQMAVSNYVQSKGEFADAVVNATITVAAIGGAVFTGGASTALLTALGAGAGSAAFSVAATQAIEGSDFDGGVKNVSKLAFKGFATGALSFIGAEMIGLKGLTAVGNETALSAVPVAMVRAGERGVTRAAFKTSEDVAKVEIEKGIAQLGRQSILVGKEETTKAIDDLAAKVLVDGATDAQKSALSSAIRESLEQEIRAGIKNKLINEAEAFVINAGSNIVADSATEVAATGLGFEKPEDLWQRLQTTAITGVAGTAAFSLAFKAVGAGGKALNAIIGKDERGLYAGPGTMIENDRGERMVVGDKEKYRFKPGDKVVEEAKAGDAVAERPPKRPDNIDIDGRPKEAGFREQIREEFKPMTEAELKASKDLVVKDLKDVQVGDGQGNFESAYSRLSKAGLNEKQTDEVLTMMAEVREHYSTMKVGDKQIGDQAVNWIHTQGEMTRVLESAAANKMTAEQTKLALISAMFSDAAKTGNTDTTKMNFWTHHLDGALAADEVMTRYGYPREQIDMVTQAIREHQIGPPEFMSMFYRLAMQGGLTARLEKAAEGSPERARLLELQKVLDENTVMTSFGPGFMPLADVNHMPVVKNGNGEWELALTPDQRELLGMTGNKSWFVPRNPELDPDFPKMSAAEKERAISTFKISQALLDGDTIDNYAALNGVSKYVAIRGPETMFSSDGTVWDSIRSVDTSYNDAYKILSPEAQPIAKKHWEEKNRILNDEQTGIRAQMDAWLREMGRDPSSEKIPFYNSPLKYPDAKKGITLDEQEQREFDFAKKIRSQMVDLLRKAARTDAQVPGDFAPVTNRVINQKK